ncbi:MAG: VCBS repeat-containing protein, partial [Planctomycetaceae bacterium]|nr:VCBS repeat-containing protein [Planctomycetaceae bacterium]
ADVDGDGDQDILLTNGDSMDGHMLKPHHGVAWLERTGEMKFQHHEIDRVPGAYGIASGDFDSDGDVDLVVVSMTWWNDVPFNSVIWYEQADGKFSRNNLEFSTAQHACVEVGDFDSDGDIDFAVGEFEHRPVKSDHLCTLWWNQSQQ